MNNAVHQLTKLILEAMAWVLNTAASLWVWSWTQIAALFGMPWGDLPGWKLAVGIAVLAVPAAILVMGRYAPGTRSAASPPRSGRWR